MTREEAINHDVVSRQAVKEQMIKYGFHAPDMTVTEFVEDLPPVNPQEKTGHWIDNHNNTISCDHCYTWFNKDDRYWYMHYCPYCNTKMIEP